MKFELQSNIFTDPNTYFISMLSDRFMPLNQRWAQALERRFGGSFKPIYILPFQHNDSFKEENFLVLNQKLNKLHQQIQRTNVIDLMYPEDLNRQFSESRVMQDLVSKLIQKQGKVFVLSFSSVWLTFGNPDVIVLGPDPEVAEIFDNKAEHVRTFQRLGLPANQAVIYPTFEELYSKHTDFPFFVSATYSSGGVESRVIYNRQDLDVFKAGLRPLNLEHEFIAAQYLDNIVHTPNTSALVIDTNNTKMVCVSDQILRGNQYMGNIYPTSISPRHHNLVCEMTTIIGNDLARAGFKGLFGCDFLITKSGECFPVDINPRRQGGYFCIANMSNKYDLIDLELALALHETVGEFEYDAYQVDYAWLHSKLPPFQPEMKIIQEFVEGDPLDPFTKIGSMHKAQYYPKDHMLIYGNPGFYLKSGKSAAQLKASYPRVIERLISNMYKTYEL